MINSGRTKSVADLLEKWYLAEYSHADETWTWGFSPKLLQELLDHKEAIPFRYFWVRYVLAVHEKDMKPILNSCLEGEEWLEKSSKDILDLMEKEENLNYKDAPELLKKLTDFVFEDFKSNYMSVDQKNIRIIDDINEEENIRIIGSIEKNKLENYVLWDKEDLLRKMSAKVFSTGFMKRADSILIDEIFAFAFGLNMDYEDISFLLKKVLKRSDFNLWDKKEFLLFFTFKYTKGDLFEFYLKLKEAYENPKNTPQKYDWKGKNSFSTMTIRSKTDEVMKEIIEKNYSIGLDNDGKLPPKVITYLRRYKYLIKNSEDYQRTVTIAANQLLQSFRSEIKDELEGIRDALKTDAETSEAEKYAKGKVLVYYDPELGLKIPKGTIFVKKEKKTGREITFVSEKEVDILPVYQGKIEVEIKVSCSEEEKKEKRKEDQKSYIEGKTIFTCNNPYLSEMINRSCFKAPTKPSVGDRITVSGNITAQCTVGKRIPVGTEFYALNIKGEKIVFKSVKEISAEVYEEIPVCGQIAGEEALKNEISSCDIADWNKKFLRINNKKIGLHTKTDNEKVRGGILYNYLYQPYGENETYVEMLLDKKYIAKLSEVLEGTMLSSSKLNEIKNMKCGNITRNDLLTLSFLSYVSKREEKRIKNKRKPHEDYKIRYGDFIQKTNDILRKCGFYELYAPNPYDSLIMCLLSSNEGINAYKNLWSWYLTNR